MPTPVEDCEQKCFDTYASDLEKAKSAATRHIIVIPWTDNDIFEPLKQAAHDKYNRCTERCKA
jgi:hypothetical protein